jgi:hypothetical protein
MGRLCLVLHTERKESALEMTHASDIEHVYQRHSRQLFLLHKERLTDNLRDVARVTILFFYTKIKVEIRLSNNNINIKHQYKILNSDKTSTI